MSPSVRVIIVMMIMEEEEEAAAIKSLPLLYLPQLFKYHQHFFPGGAGYHSAFLLGEL